MTSTDWSEFGDLVCGILDAVYEQDRELYEMHAEQRGISVQQLASAAIVGALQQQSEQAEAAPRQGGERPGRSRPRRHRR
jgi:hypothetical protein